MKYEQTFLVTVTSEKPIENLGAKISNRMWTMDTVTRVESHKVRNYSAVVNLKGEPIGFQAFAELEAL